MLKHLRTLLTITGTVLLCGPLARDSNGSHLTNPLWPPHARFHFFWSLTFSALLGVLHILWLWRGPVRRDRLWASIAVQLCGLPGGFFAALAFAPLYGGAVRDSEHHVQVAGINENILVFGTLTVLVLVASALLVRVREETAA